MIALANWYFKEVMIVPNPWRKLPVHRIGTFAEHGLAPHIVSTFLDKALEVGCINVVDPFVGSGVVAVEAQERCLSFIGVDANPWSLVLVAAKTKPLDYSKLLSWVEERLKEVNNVEPLIPTQRLKRYHPEPVLKALGRLRRIVEEAQAEWRPLLLAVLGSTAHKHSFLRRSPAPRHDRKHVDERPESVYKNFRQLLYLAVNDLQNHHFCGAVDLVWGDSTAWLPSRICGLLTSPPFANNLDYVRHTMLELFWAGIARDSSDLGWLRSIQIPSCEAAARPWRGETTHLWIRSIVDKVGGSRTKGYRRFLLQYFHAMEKHFELLSERLEWQAWYTIGDSILGGTYVPVHKILGKLAEAKGLRVSVEVLGKRLRPQRNLYLLVIRARR